MAAVATKTGGTKELPIQGKGACRKMHSKGLEFSVGLKSNRVDPKKLERETRQSARGVGQNPRKQLKTSREAQAPAKKQRSSQKSFSDGTPKFL